MQIVITESIYGTLRANRMHRHKVLEQAMTGIKTHRENSEQLLPIFLRELWRDERLFECLKMSMSLGLRCFDKEQSSAWTLSRNDDIWQRTDKNLDITDVLKIFAGVWIGIWKYHSPFIYDALMENDPMHGHVLILICLQIKCYLC